MSNMETEHFKFYSNRDCEYFPCHKLPGGMKEEDFNCLFCYCPLYALGEKCGGNFSYSDEIKDCSACLVPHMKNSHEYISSRFKDISRIASSEAEARAQDKEKPCGLSAVPETSCEPDGHPAYSERVCVTSEEKLRVLIEQIMPADEEAMEAARVRQLNLAKPTGSLGALEEIAVRIAGMTGRLYNRAERGCVVVMCADNGVVEEGISLTPQSVTRSQTINFTKRLTGVGALVESFGSELLIVDVGIKDEIPQQFYCREPFADTRKIVYRSVRAGTDNIALGSAMSRQEALKCIDTGIEMAYAAKNKGFDMIGIGEMGIGNTTTASAVLSAITGCGADVTVGRGGGLSSSAFARKKDLVDRITAKYKPSGVMRDAKVVNQETSSWEKAEGSGAVSEMIDVLAAVGGFDICAMAGVYIGAALNRIPAVIDGFISVVAALAAAVMSPSVIDYLITSHRSAEAGYKLAAETLGLKPFLDLGMRLGEGSGCPIAFQVIKGACDVMNNMGTFEEVGIDDAYLRSGDPEILFE